MIKNVGRSAWLAKVDITSAFKVMSIHPYFWYSFGIRWRGRFYFSIRLTFGCRSSPNIFDMLSEAICWILANNYSVPHLIHLLDDFLIISPPDAIPAKNITTVQIIFTELGVPIAQEKSLGPTQFIEFLGINLDSRLQASLPKEKIDRIILVASSFAEGHNCSKRDLLSLLGHFNFAMRIIPQGHPFISHLLALASSVHAFRTDQIIINQACHNEISLWITFLKQWNGLTFFFTAIWSFSPTTFNCLLTQPHPSVSGDITKGIGSRLHGPPQMRDSPQSSALFKLYPLVIAAFLWGKNLTSSSILVHCDNEATVHCINKGRSHSLALMPLLRHLIWISTCDQFIITAKHIPGSKNQIADSLSHFMFQKFRALAPEADPSPTPVPH